MLHVVMCNSTISSRDEDLKHRCQNVKLHNIIDNNSYLWDKQLNALKSRNPMDDKHIF